MKEIEMIEFGKVVLAKYDTGPSHSTGPLLLPAFSNYLTGSFSAHQPHTCLVSIFFFDARLTDQQGQPEKRMGRRNAPSNSSVYPTLCNYHSMTAHNNHVQTTKT